MTKYRQDLVQTTAEEEDDAIVGRDHLIVGSIENWRMGLSSLGVVDAQLTSSVRLWLFVEVVHAAHLTEGCLQVGIIDVGDEITTIIAGNHLHLKDLNVEVLDA